MAKTEMEAICNGPPVSARRSLHLPQEILRIGYDIVIRKFLDQSPKNLLGFGGLLQPFMEHLRGLKQIFPTYTYEGSMALYLGDRRVELHNLGHAHSKGDTMVYLPKERILYSGDFCFNFVTPATFDAHIGNWIKRARQVLKTFSLKTVVPGHGPVGDRRIIEDVADYLALVGDSADGIPGIPRWGAKSAAALLNRYGSLERIPADCEQWTVEVRGAEALARTLAEHRERATLYKRLATLRTDVPLEESLEDLRWDGVRLDLLEPLCEEFGDSRTLDQVAKWFD